MTSIEAALYPSDDRHDVRTLRCQFSSLEQVEALCRDMDNDEAETCPHCCRTYVLKAPRWLLLGCR